MKLSPLPILPHTYHLPNHTHIGTARSTHTCACASRNIIAGAQSTRPLGAEHRAHCSAAHARDLGPLQGITVNYIANILRSSESTLSGNIYEEAVVFVHCMGYMDSMGYYVELCYFKGYLQCDIWGVSRYNWRFEIRSLKRSWNRKTTFIDAFFLILSIYVKDCWDILYIFHLDVIFDVNKRHQQK